jgi:uncharacterized protein
MAPNSSVSSVQDIAPEKLTDIRRLFAAMGMKQMQAEGSRGVLDAAGEQIAASVALDEKSQEWAALVVARLKKKFMEADFDTVLVPVYDRCFSGDEVRGLVAFFETPLAGRFLGVQPQITRDSIAAAAQLAKQVAEDSVREILAERPDLVPRAPSAASRTVN